MGQRSRVAPLNAPSVSGHEPTPSRQAAEASLHLVRRRYWTIRRVAFTIAYRGIFVFLVLGPCVVVGVTLWKTGAISQFLRVRLPIPAVQSGQPISKNQSGSMRQQQTWVIQNDAAMKWVQGVLQAYPAVQPSQVVFSAAGVEIQGTIGPAAQPIAVAITLVVNDSRIGGVIRRVTLGGVTGGSAETVVRPLLEPLISSAAADFNRQYIFSSVAVEGNSLRVVGAVR